MPILPITLQRRQAELGRIRLGDKGSKGQPQKLAQFRFTSPHERHIRDLAQLYGGEARAWRNGTKDEWEVYTTARSIPVIVVRGGMSQWLETWSGGGCQRRCDGARETLSDSPCICDSEDGPRACKPTTRLSVMLRDLGAVGVFRLESHGWNAAAELPSTVELAQYVGDLVPATLLLAERSQVKDGRTSKFVVPVLDLEVTPARLTAIAREASGAPALASAPAVPALEARRPDYEGQAAAAQTVEQVRSLWVEAGDAGHLDDDLKALLTARVQALQPAPAATSDQPQDPAPDPDWVAPPTKTAGSDADDTWDAIVAQAGRLGWSISTLVQEIESEYAQPRADLDATQLTDFLEQLRKRVAA